METPLPKCAVLICPNEADPRWYARDVNDQPVMICDGHVPMPKPSEVTSRPSDLTVLDLAARITHNGYSPTPREVERLAHALRATQVELAELRDVADLVRDADISRLSPELLAVKQRWLAGAHFTRTATGLPALDYVLGGGLVAGAIVLLAAPLDIGASSLALQMLAGLQHRCLYVTGKETREQVVATARRVEALTNRIYVLNERDPSRIFDQAHSMHLQTIVIDTIQDMDCDDVKGRPGFPAQVRKCTEQFVHFAKTTGTALWLIGHVTSDGTIAGPRTLEHDVDVVLKLEQGTRFEGNERILRCLGKNRFGANNVVGYFELTAKGLVSAEDPHA
jgi:DNA repair protein RadA/Sms